MMASKEAITCVPDVASSPWLCKKSCCASSKSSLLGTPNKIAVHTRLKIWPAQRNLEAIGLMSTRSVRVASAVSLLLVLSATK
jgi:hypothetical protein